MHFFLIITAYFAASAAAFGVSNKISAQSKQIRKSYQPANTKQQTASHMAIYAATSIAAPIGFLTKLLQAYENVLVKSPWPTKIISSGIIGGLGDILIQYVENRGNKGTSGFNFRRFAVFTSVAALYIAPSINTWFTYLSDIKQFDKLSNFWKAMYMMLIDQTVGAVLINGGFFYAFALADYIFPPYKTRTDNFIKTANNAIKSNFWLTLKTNWASWPIINFVNFLIIPLRYRLLFSNFFAVFWNMFLSNVANKK